MKKTKQNKITVLFPDPEEAKIIKEAIEKINQKAGHGVDLKLSSFIRDCAVEKAREVLKGK